MAHGMLVSALVPFGLNWVFELGWTGLGMGLAGFGTEGMGPGLDNKGYFILHVFMMHLIKAKLLILKREGFKDNSIQ